MKNFLAKFGVKTTGKETQEELAADVLRAERTMATTVDPQLWQKYAEIFKVGNVVDINTLMRFKSGVGGKPVSKEALEGDLTQALAGAKGGTEGKSLIELQKEFNNSMIYLGQKFDKFADGMADWFIRNQPTVRPATPEDKEKPFGFNPPTPEQRKKGFGWEFNIPLDRWWNNIKNLFGSPLGSAKAGELAPTGSSNDPVYVKPSPDLVGFSDVGPGYPNGTGWQPGLFAGPYGTTPGGNFAAPGAGYGPGRSAGGYSYPGKINMPAVGGRAGRSGSAGFGLYASDVGLAVSKSMSPEERAFLDTIGTGETPTGSYSNIDNDPGGLGGRYQFLRSTWVNEARKAGIDPGNFSPENQDKVAAFYADELARERTGKSLRALLGSGPEGVRQAIAAVHGVWNGIYNVDRDKQGHSGAIALFMKKLKDEQAASGASSRVYNPNKGLPTDVGTDAPGSAPADIFMRPGKQSLNNTNMYQQDKSPNIKISNLAGASVNVQSVMLGGVQGSFA